MHGGTGRGGHNNERLTLDIADAAMLLGISIAATYRAAKADEIPSVKLGGRRLVLREPFMQMLNSGTAA
jgi:excisionase family DNA binding protein